MRSITLFVGALVGTASAQTEGDLKLVNGRTAGGYDGLLQVYYKGAWSSVCSGLGAYGSGSYFEDSHATLVCKQLFNTDWVSWTVDEGHCYTPLTGGGIVELEDPYVYDYSTYTYTATTYTTFLEAVDGRSGGPSACTHDEDVSIVCGFDGSESSTDASLDLSCVRGYCSPGYKECGGDGSSYYAPWCCGGDFPDCGSQYGGCEGPSRTEWKSPSGLVASMARGRNLWFPHRDDDDDDDDDWICMRFFIFIGMWVVIVVLLSISISVCCFSCPGCPAYRYGPKDAVAAAVSPAAQPQVAQPPGGEDPGQKGPLGTLPAP